MNYLRNKLTNVVTEALDPQGPEYTALVAQRTTADHEITPDASVEGLFGGPYTVHAGQSVWEDVPERRAKEFPNRCLVGVLDAAGAAVDTQIILSEGLPNDITITAATYTPNAAIKGNDTNYRTVSVKTATETSLGKEPEAPTPVTAAKLAFKNAVNGVAGEAKAITLEEAAKLKAKAGVNVVVSSVHTAAGLVDPGGLVLVTYTHD